MESSERISMVSAMLRGGTYIKFTYNAKVPYANFTFTGSVVYPQSLPEEDEYSFFMSLGDDPLKPEEIESANRVYDSLKKAGRL